MNNQTSEQPSVAPKTDIESQPPVSLHTLRNAVEIAERQVARLDASNVEAYLLSLDQIEQWFVAFDDDPDAVRSEQTRWVTLHNRITANPGLIISPASKAGGLAKLRAQHPPAQGFWWHLDTSVSGQRRQSLQRNGLIVGVVVLVALLAWAGITFFAGGNTSSVSMSEATTQIEQLVRDQKWSEALGLVENARESSPDDPGLLVWEAVLAEQTGDARAVTALDEAQQKMAAEPTAFWLLVGNSRLQAGNLSGAEEAGQQALALSPQDPTVTLLLGSVAEERGDIAQALDYFNQTIELAGDSNPQLVVIVRVRMGNLSQRVDPFPEASLTETVTQTVAP